MDEQLQKLDALADWMRERGATYARCGDIELTLGAEPVRAMPAVALIEEEAQRAEKSKVDAYLKNLLWASEGAEF